MCRDIEEGGAAAEAAERLLPHAVVAELVLLDGSMCSKVQGAEGGAVGLGVVGAALGELHEAAAVQQEVLGAVHEVGVQVARVQRGGVGEGAVLARDVSYGNNSPWLIH